MSKATQTELRLARRMTRLGTETAFEVLVREVELESGFDAVGEGRALVDDAAGRRAPTVAVPPVVVGRRGGTASLEPEEGALEAILRRMDEVGVEGVGSFFCCGLPGALERCEGAPSPAASLAGVGASIFGTEFQGRPAQIKG